MPSSIACRISSRVDCVGLILFCRPALAIPRYEQRCMRDKELDQVMHQAHGFVSSFHQHSR